MCANLHKTRQGVDVEANLVPIGTQIENSQVEIDLIQQNAELESIYKKWVNEIYSEEYSPIEIKEMLKDIQTNEVSRVDFINEISGLIVLVVQLKETETPLECYDYAKLAIINRTAELDLTAEPDDIFDHLESIVVETVDKFDPNSKLALVQSDLGETAVKSVEEKVTVTDETESKVMELFAEDRQETIEEYPEEIIAEETDIVPEPVKNSGYLNFHFRIDGVPVKDYSKDAFASLGLSEKIVLGIGEASTFEQTDEQYIKYIVRFANKGKRGKPLSEEQVRTEIKNLIDSGYVQNGGSRYSYTSACLDLLEITRLEKQDSLISFVNQSEQEKEILVSDESDIWSLLPGQRGAEAFHVGQKIAVYFDNKIQLARVTLAKAYEGSLTYSEPSYELGGLKQKVLERSLFRRHSQIKSGDSGVVFKEDEDYIDAMAASNFVGSIPEVIFGPESEFLRRKLALTFLTNNLVPNPCPGFIRISFEETGSGLIADMDNNYLIPLNAWEHLVNDSEYLDHWVNNGSEESVRNGKNLKLAILDAHQRKLIYI